MLFLESARGKPWVTYGSGPSETNALHAPYEVPISNARLGGAPSLDKQGFELIRHVTGVRNFADDQQAETLGRGEAEAIVQAATGAAYVLVFDHTLRRRAPEAARQPSTRVHIDYTEYSAPQRVRDLLGAQAEALLDRRVAFINVWRPINHAAEDWPLALCDARSVRPKDLVATDIIYPGRRGEIYGLRHHPAQRWSYFPAMQLDEAVLIKCYDSQTDVARFTPHTAFADPTTPPGARPRESIEFRAIAFFD
jgi:hypothetical protein